MKKSNKSKLKTWKSNLNNRLYFFTSIFILIILFVVVIYFTKQPITAGKAFNVVYKDNTEGKFPLTITFTKENGVLTKEAYFFDGSDEFILSIGNIVGGKIQTLTVTPKVEDVKSDCGDNVCDVIEDSLSCAVDCKPDLIVESISYTGTETSALNTFHTYNVNLKNQGSIIYAHYSSKPLKVKIMLYDDNGYYLDSSLILLNPEDINPQGILTIESGAVYPINVYFKSDLITNSNLAHINIVADTELSIDESNENNNEYWFNEVTPQQSLCIMDGFCDINAGETKENCPNDCKQLTLFEPESLMWIDQPHIIGDCTINEDSENTNTYINNPFIPGTLTYFKAGESQGTFDKDIYYNSGTTYYLQEKYCENGAAKTRTYKCSKGVFSTTDITSSGCYCMVDSQCGDGKTCVFIPTKNFGKCT